MLAVFQLVEDLVFARNELARFLGALDGDLPLAFLVVGLEHVAETTAANYPDGLEFGVR